MLEPGLDPREDSISDLVGRLIEDGREYAQAEIGLYRQIARYRAGRAKKGMVLFAAGAILLLSSLTALILAFVLGLATLIGPFGSGLVVAFALAGGGYLLVRTGMKGLSALSGDDEERQALAKGESLR